MKKLIFTFLTIILAAGIVGCSKEPSPEERFAQYIKLWNDQKFEEMYGFLSNKAKESVSKEDFVNRYSKIYKDLEIEKLDVDFKKPEDEEKPEDKASYSYRAKMQSVAGPISFDHTAKLVKEKRGDKENWYVDWNTTYIFPELESSDRISFKNTPAKRGEISDINGNGLAINGSALQIGVVPGQLGAQKDATISQLSALLDMSPEEINKSLNADWVKPDLFVPLKKISKNDIALREQLFAMDGVTNQKAEAREYPYGESVSHLLGYVGPVTADDLAKLEGKGYTANDVIGKRGFEQVLEEKLKGKNGIKISILKKDGSEKLLAEKPVEHGQNIQLTIDVVLQQQIYDQLKGETGASAAINPVTGETLALVSSPGFDPNAMALGISPQKLQALEDDPLQPLLNRFKANYAPGSVIKPITAAIGLSSGKINLNTAYEINDKRWQKDSSWGSYHITRVTDVKGQIDLEKALIYSDNIYFARAALDIGKDSFIDGLKKFGFEKELDYLYPVEPSKTGSMDNEKMLADSGYGQGQVEMSVLHLAAAYTPFVNKGNMIKPVLQNEDTKNQILQEGLVSEENKASINRMLTKVVTDPNGTAYSAQINGYPLAGKTGTAELKLKQGEKGQELGWFVAYNPQSPELLISMMIENVQEKGGSKAAVSRVKEVFAARLQ
ncbi:penicillin-binding transpeptidase domain-containing protein [Bacillus sp. T33-2]|uniref:penicillin-binding transpeptidase domain-containing protein n=1 Tax=Bacillus sp. T33-2 TaxID=2054168 RepID=UPI000C77627E|nr:penicillin-binding transpeptidase domain-containing protein [Bacillus sp. T33-2]PLR94491.1 peptidoglycan glycosyltransferase [Bacillus sp. T33-2]